MRTVKNLFFATSLLLSFSMVAEARTAVVDFAGAVFNSTKAQQMIEEIQQDSDFVAMRTRAEALEAEFKQLQEEFNKNELTWGDEQKAEANQRAFQMNQERENIGRALNQAVQSNVMRELQPKAAEALDELIKEEKVTILISADAVLMVAPEANLTEKLVQRINKKVQ